MLKVYDNLVDYYEWDLELSEKYWSQFDNKDLLTTDTFHERNIEISNYKGKQSEKKVENDWFFFRLNCNAAVTLKD